MAALRETHRARGPPSCGVSYQGRRIDVMPDPRTIGLEQNSKSQFDVEPDDDEINPKAQEPDYRANAKPERDVERLPFKNVKG